MLFFFTDAFALGGGPISFFSSRRVAWNCSRRVILSCWTNTYCFLYKTKRGRSPTWHHISIENQDHNVSGSWEVSAATSLSSEFSVSGILRGTNVEKLWGSFIPRTWMLSWKISLSNLLHALISSVLLFILECYINARENSMCSVVTKELQKNELCYQELDNLPQTLEKTKLLLTVACI